MSKSKRYKALKEKVDSEKKYPVEEGLSLISEMKSEKFDQTVDVAICLGIDSKQSDQKVKGAVNLPHGLGKDVVVVAFAKGEKEKEASEAGADFVGGDDLVEKIQGGWTAFDKVVATPDMMAQVGKVGKVLGPRGLMPNPKTGTVTFEIGKAVKECKAGKVSYKSEDKGGIIHGPIGKVSFGPDKLKDNLISFVESVVRAKPASSKGIYLKNISVSATTTPSVGLDVSTVTA
jgi:large subunit ribosomal protein L1